LGKQRRKPQAGAKPLLREHVARGSPLRERAAGPTRCAARASPLASRARGPGPDPLIPLLDHRGGGRLRSAPRGTPRRFAPRACGPGSDLPIPLLDHRGGGRPRSAPRVWSGSDPPLPLLDHRGGGHLRSASARCRRRAERRVPTRCAARASPLASRAHGPGSDPPILLLDNRGGNCLCSAPRRTPCRPRTPPVATLHSPG
jgi:hypothetical protein